MICTSMTAPKEHQNQHERRLQHTVASRATAQQAHNKSNRGGQGLRKCISLHPVTGREGFSEYSLREERTTKMATPRVSQYLSTRLGGATTRRISCKAQMTRSPLNTNNSHRTKLGRVEYRSKDSGDAQALWLQCETFC